MNILTTISNPLDEAISRWFLGLAESSSKWVSFMTTCSAFYMFFFIVALLLLFKKETRSIGILMFIAQILSWILVELILKKPIARDRPFLDPAFIDITKGVPYGFNITGFSMPSGHSVISTSGAWTFFFYYLFIDKRKTKVYLGYSIVFIIINFLVMLSRIALLHHYFTDCLAGFGIGIIFSLAAVLIYKTILHHKELKTQSHQN